MKWKQVEIHESRSKLSREEIVKGLLNILPKEQVITDEQTLKENSCDRFRKYPSKGFGIYTLPYPAAVAKVKNTEEVSKVLKFLNENKINCVPRTGSTATEGGLETTVKDSVVVDGSLMKKVIKIDEEAMQVTGECGVILGDLEDKLRSMGYTTGHSPQSKPQAQLGGLVATRSIGQLSTYYGAIEDMIVGLEAVFPDGTITRIKNVPRRAAGPDIRHVIVGNEGTLCYITEVTIKIFKYMPQNMVYLGWKIDDMHKGLDIIREIIVSGLRPSLCRVYSEEDAHQHFYAWHEGKCVLTFATEGLASIAKAASEEIIKIVEKHKGVERVDPKLIENWFSNLCWGQDKIDAETADMKANHRLGYTTEVSGTWAVIKQIYDNCIARIKKDFAHMDDITMLGAHSSHSYPNGTNLYFVYDYNINCKPEDEINEYHIPLNAMIVEETLKAGGSMCHHHGIGKYRTEWTKEEHGSAYYILEKLKKTFDPNDIMNKGSIFRDN